MKDTPSSIEQIYNRMLMDLAPEERLAMACRMFSAAKALIRAGIQTGEVMSEADLRSFMFIRLYGQDFDQVRRDRILSRLKAT